MYGDDTRIDIEPAIDILFYEEQVKGKWNTSETTISLLDLKNLTILVTTSDKDSFAAIRGLKRMF